LNILNVNSVKFMSEPRVVIQITCRDEGLILKEFIVHNIVNLGVSHVFIYDDRSRTPVSDEISLLTEDIKSHVTVRRLECDYRDAEFKASPYYDKSLVEENDHRQHYCMAHFLKERHSSGDIRNEWCLYCDCDEFVFLPDDIVTLPRLAELSRMNGHVSVGLKWLMYGSSGIVDRDIQKEECLFELFPRHAAHLHPDHKSFVDLSALAQDVQPGFRIGDVHNPSKHCSFFQSETRELCRTPHIAHFHKSGGARGFLESRIRPRMSTGTCYVAHLLLYMLLSGYETVSTLGLMDKYIHPIKDKLGYTVLSHVPVDESSVAVCALVSGGCVISPSTSPLDISDITGFIQDRSLRYASWGEILPENFDADGYRMFNEDLRDHGDHYLKQHYFLYGAAEGRIYSFDFPQDFDPMVYEEINHLQLGEHDPRVHFAKWGHAHKLMYKVAAVPQDFSPQEYRELNPDLHFFTDLQAQHHYGVHGLLEGRSYIASVQSEWSLNHLPCIAPSPETV